MIAARATPKEPDVSMIFFIGNSLVADVMLLMVNGCVAHSALLNVLMELPQSQKTSAVIFVILVFIIYTAQV
jgi:hypothetical protein